LKEAGDPRATKEERFRSLYDAQYASISSYVRRRVTGWDGDVPDIVAEVFAVTWRRFDDVPAPPEGRLWLYGVARRVVGRHQRASTRRRRLHARLVAEPLESPGQVSLLNSGQSRVQLAINNLGARDQEVLRLVLWEELSHAEAARVLGCSVNAVGLRLKRAKNRVRAELLIASGPPRPIHLIPDHAFERKSSS
jgi:RNA polymerase sigma-70 factor (ECF subfamily)